MAKLSEFRIDTRAMQDGEWVSVPEFGDLEILARGATDAFLDAQRALEGRYARQYGSREAIPNAVSRAINAQLLEEHLIMDVRNLEDDEGQPVPVKRFCTLLRDPGYTRLATAAWTAVSRVSTRIQDELDTASGNLSAPSKTNSNGEAHEQH